MLTVPTGENGNAAFDKGDWGHRHGKLKAGPHALDIPGGEEPVERRGAILAGADYQLRAGENRDGRQTGEESAAGSVFDDVGLRCGMTDLHEKADAFAAEMEQADGREIPDLMNRTERFLREGRDELLSRASTDGQRRAGEAFFAAFAGQQVERTRRMAETKTAAFDEEVAARQREAFRREVLRPESLFDDAAAWGSVDMALRGAEGMLSRLPEAERTERAREIAGEMLRPVLDRRLCLDPEKAGALAADPDVGKILGGESAAAYVEKATAAVKDESMRAEAKRLAASGADPAEAEKTIRASYPDKGERAKAAEQYAHYRYNRNRDAVVDMGREVDAAWRTIRSDGVRRGSIPVEVRRNNPALNDFLERSVKRTQENGGAAPAPDYAHLLDVAAGFKPREAAEALRDAGAFYDRLDRLGGPESPATATYMRLFTGESTPEDKAFLADLGLAKREAERRLPALAASPESLSRYLAEYAAAREEQMRRGKYTRLQKHESQALAAAVLGDGSEYRAKASDENSPS